MRAFVQTLFAILVLTLAVGAQAQTQQTSKYDKFTDETRVSVRYFHPIKGVNMEAKYRYKGQADRIVPPKSVELVFIVIGRNYFTEGMELFVLSDEKRLRFQSSDISENILGVRIPFDKFESLMAGKKIEMRLGTDNLSLSDSDLKALRDFLPQKIKP